MNAIAQRCLWFFMMSFPYLLFCQETCRVRLETLSSPQEASSLQGMYVQVQGFYLPLSPTEGRLASLPHLSACCLSSAHSIGVSGTRLEEWPTHRPILLEGQVQVTPSDVVLIHAHLRSSPTAHFSFLLAAGGITSLLLLLFSYFRKKRG